MFTFGCFHTIDVTIFLVITLITSIAKSLSTAFNPVGMLTHPGVPLLSLDSISWWLSTKAPQVPNSGLLNLWKIFIVNWHRLIITRFSSTSSFLLGGNRLIFHRFWCIRKQSICNLSVSLDLWRILWDIPQFFRQNRNFLLHDFCNRVRIEDFDLFSHDLIN